MKSDVFFTALALWMIWGAGMYADSNDWYTAWALFLGVCIVAKEGFNCILIKYYKKLASVD